VGHRLTEEEAVNGDESNSRRGFATFSIGCRTLLVEARCNEARKVFTAMMGTALRCVRKRMITSLPTACGFLTVVSLCGWVSTSSLSAQDDASSLLTAGLSRFQEGDLDAAIALFEKAFAADPSDDQVGQFVEGATHARVYRMVRSDDPRISGIGREILRMSSRATFAAADDVEAVKTAVQTVIEGDPDSEETIRKKVFYAASLGRNIVPHLIPYLGDSELDLRAQAMTWISMVGVDSLPPLVAGCKHPNSRVRTNIALLLGGRRLRHAYSLGYLRAMSETDEVEEVKDEADRSFDAILAGLNGAGGSAEEAKVYFLRTAAHFYLNPYRNPFDIRKYSPTVYSLEGENVVGTRILPFQVSEEMAKQCVTEALLLDSNYTPARVLNVCNDAGRVVEYDTNAKWYAMQDGHEGIKALIAQQRPYVDLVLRNRVLSTPSMILYTAIQQAARDGRADVARTLVEAAQTIGLRGEVPEALVQSLEDDGSRLVRIAAAVTLAYWNPQEGFDAGQQVVDILANAVETSGVRTVVKGMGNQSVANRFDSLFRTRLNMESLLHDTNVEELLHTLRRSPPDVVFLDEKIGFASVERATAPINVIVNEMRKDYRTANVPVIVVVDPARVVAAKDAFENEER